MRPDWYFNCGCLFDLGGWILDFQDQRTPQEYLEDMRNGRYGKLREEKNRIAEDDSDPDDDDLGGTELSSKTVSENDTK